ncbi:MAG: hypothetical protein WD648_08900 [Planctomycetaceae bacterium]
MFRLPSVSSLSVIGLAVFCCLAVAVDSRSQDQPTTKAPEEKAAAPPTSAGENDFLKAEPYDGRRSTLAGRWLLAIFNGKGENDPLFVIDISGSEGGPLIAEPVSMIADFAGTTVKSIAQKDGLLELELNTPGAPLLFQGRRNGPVIRGSVAAPSGIVFPARLYAARAASFDAYKNRDEAHLTEMAEAWTSEGKLRIGKLQEFVAKFPESALALDAAEEVLRQADLHNMELPDAEKAAETFRKLAEHWGPRMVQDSRIATVSALSRSPRFAQLALKYATAAEEHIADTVHEQGRTRLALGKARALIATGNEDSRNQGAETLRQMHQKYKLDTRIAADLLDFERQFGQLDKAIEIAAQLVAYPPTGEEFQRWQSAAKQGLDYVGALQQQLTELWTKKHNDTSGLEAYLDTVYLQSLDLVADEKPEPQNTNGKNRVALYEMFTGASCAPCIAADLSLARIEHTFPTSDVIVLRYHQHSPGPDPLVNDDGQQRLAYYEGQGTPSAFANGLPVSHIGGLLDNAPAAYTRLREPIDSINQTPSDIDVRLTADVKDGVIDFSATADGVQKIARERRFGKTGVMIYLLTGGGLLLAIVLLLAGPRTKRYLTSRIDTPWMHALLMRRIRWLLAAGFLVGAAAAGYQLVPTDEDIGDLRLRLALAENGIYFAAPNGIRIHDGIVRVMPGGPDGIKPSGGRLAFSGSIDLFKLRGQLAQELADFERRNNLEFRERPLDLERLHLVAFVQNDTSNEILQSAAVALAGLPPSPKKPSEKPSQTDPAAGNEQPQFGPVLSGPTTGTDGPVLAPPPPAVIPTSPIEPTSKSEQPKS